ncbi:hypothetical protein FS749_008133 [Ceratobasidium sp. UAMH 11750]|nr:hypothetical protein FS749_008133 [Ceratobasidium sp. UAMH 11750]
MRAEVVLPSPRRSNLGGTGFQARRPVEPNKGEQRPTLQQPTSDPSSLDRSLGREGRLHGSSERESVDPTYQPSSTQDSEYELPVEKSRDEHGRFVSNHRFCFSFPSTLQKSALLDHSQCDSSVLLGSFHYERPQRRRRTSGPKNLGLRTVENHQSGPTQDDVENPFAGETIDASGPTLGRLAGPPDHAPDSPPLNAFTPRVAF